MKPLVLLFLCLLLTTATASDYRVFTNKQGDEIRARLLRVEDEKAEIEREDGQVFRIDLDLLSEEDVAFARNFATAQIITKDPRFQITARRSRIDRTRNNRHPDWRGGLQIEVEEEEVIYLIKIKNGSSHPVSDFRIHYQILHQANDHGLRTPLGVLRLKGDVEIPFIAARSEVEIPTKPIRYLAKVEREIVRERQGKTIFEWIRSKDDVIGLWTRVEVGGEIVREESSPDGLSDDYAW